jgi:hypothetical protein
VRLKHRRAAAAKDQTTDETCFGRVQVHDVGLVPAQNAPQRQGLGSSAWSG